MPDRPDEFRILVPDEDRARVQRMVTRRQALLAGGGAAMAAYLASCGGSSGTSGGGGGGGGGGEEDAAAKPPTPADGKVEEGDLLLANWVDYSDPKNYKDYQAEVRAEGVGLGLRLQRRAARQAARRRLQLRRRLPHGLRGEDDGRPRAAHPAHQRADPEHEEHLARVHEDGLRPGQRVLRAEGLRHHELLLAHRQGVGDAGEHQGLLRPAQERRAQGPAGQLPRGRHAGRRAGARRARLLDQLGGPGRDRRGQAAADRRQAERRHDQLDVHRPRDPRRDRLRHGLERRHPPRDRRPGQEGPRDGLPRARGPDGVLGRQLVHPDRVRAPGRRAQVDRLRARPGGRRARDELPPVPGAGRGHHGRRPEARRTTP